jgi:hypothetical protein
MDAHTFLSLILPVCKSAMPLCALSVLWHDCAAIVMYIEGP